MIQPVLVLIIPRYTVTRAGADSVSAGVAAPPSPYGAGPGLGAALLSSRSVGSW
jgi:hypothetical protein